MDGDSESIRRQMAATSAALTGKLNLFERRVVEDLQGVAATAEEAAASVQEGIGRTVGAVKNCAQEAAAAVGHACDLKDHVNRRPWTAVTAAVALGFVMGRLLHSGKGTGLAPTAEKLTSRDHIAGPEHEHAALSSMTGMGNVTSSVHGQSGWFTKVGDLFEPEWARLKELAVGTLLRVARDVVSESVPEPMEREVVEVFDRITTKLGGQPFRGRLVANAAEDVPKRQFVEATPQKG